MTALTSDSTIYGSKVIFSFAGVGDVLC